MARPTLVSLATELGVSRQTVSNVLNAPHLVKPETRQRVQDAIERSGYRPNTAAQALRKQRSMTLAMRDRATIDGINGAVMDRFLHQLVLAAKHRGYSLLLVTATGDDDEVAVLREMHERGRIDGCILHDTHLDDERPRLLAEAGLEVAVFGRPWGREASSNHLWIDVDGGAGTGQATRHLLSAGYRRIAFLGWPGDSEVGADRRSGWERVLRDAGLGDQARMLRGEGIDRIEVGFQEARRLLADGAEAFVCASDSLALGALEAVRQWGERAVEERPIFGFDNTPVAAAVGISSVDQNVEQAADLLLERLGEHLAGSPDNGRARPETPVTDGASLDHHLISPRLVVRRVGSLFTTPTPTP